MELVATLGWVALAFFAAFVLWDVARRAIDQRRREQDAKALDDATVTKLGDELARHEGRIRALEGGAGRGPAPRPSIKQGLGLPE